MYQEQLKNSIIFVGDQNAAIYIPSPTYSIGLYSYSGPEINLKKWFMRALHGDPSSIKMLFEDPELTSQWWEYVREHKNQFLSKNFIKHNLVLLKKFFNTLSYSSQFNKVDLHNDTQVIKFFIEYDFCNQVLAAGKYEPNVINPDFLQLLSDKQILDLMHNHITVLEDKIDLSNLQNNPQHDTLNHVCTHVILEFWKWQGWI
jgi:hypothetical protein